MNKDFVLNRIRELRIKRGISEREMSRALGHYPSYLANLAVGKRMPSLEVIDDCCNYFGITASEFFHEQYDGGPSDLYILQRLNQIADEEDKQKIIKLLNILNSQKLKDLLYIFDEYARK